MIILKNVQSMRLAGILATVFSVDYIVCFVPRFVLREDQSGGNCARVCVQVCFLWGGGGRGEKKSLLV